MRNFRLVFMLQLKNMLRPDRSRSSKKRILWLALMAITYAVVAAAFIMLILELGEVFVAFSLQAEFVSLILLCGLMVVLVFCIVTVLTTLYFSRDTEFFLALPVKPSTVFAAKLALVYVCELCFTALLLLPCLIAAGVVMHVSALYYALMPLAVLFTPAVPLFLASIIAIPIMYIVSFFRNRGAWGSVLVLVLFGGFLAAYYFGINKMQNVDPEQLDLSGVQHIFVRIADTVYPLYALARAMTGSSVFGLGTAASTVVNLAVGFGCIAALGALALMISAAVYKRGAAKQLEGDKRHKAKAVEYRSSNATKALMKKEWREIVRTPSFALNCFLGIIMCPIVAAFIGLSVNVTKIANEAATAGTPLSQYATRMLSVFSRLLMLWMILFISVGTNGAPPTAFSREGEKFCFCKLMPVDIRTQVRAKSYVYMAVGGISAVLGVIVSAIVNFDVAFFVCSLVFMPLVIYASVHFGIWMDLLSPKLKWVTPNEVMKHNKTVLTYIFGSLGIGLVLIAAAFGIYFGLTRVAGTALAAAGMWTWLILAALTAAVSSHILLYKNCERILSGIVC